MNPLRWSVGSLPAVDLGLRSDVKHNRDGGPCGPSQTQFRRRSIWPESSTIQTEVHVARVKHNSDGGPCGPSQAQFRRRSMWPESSTIQTEVHVARVKH